MEELEMVNWMYHQMYLPLWASTSAVTNREYRLMSPMGGSDWLQELRNFNVTMKVAVMEERGE